MSRFNSPYIADSTGNYALDPTSLAHVYTYDGSNNLLTDTCTDGAKTWKKTFTYTSSLLTAESAWVVQ